MLTLRLLFDEPLMLTREYHRMALAARAQQGSARIREQRRRSIETTEPEETPEEAKRRKDRERKRRQRAKQKEARANHEI